MFFFEAVSFFFFSLLECFWEDFGPNLEHFSDFGAHFFEEVDLSKYIGKPMVFIGFWTPGGTLKRSNSSQDLVFFLTHF